MPSALGENGDHLTGVLGDGRGRREVGDGLDVAPLRVGDAAGERLCVGRDVEEDDRARVDPDGDEVQADGRDTCFIV